MRSRVRIYLGAALALAAIATGAILLAEFAAGQRDASDSGSRLFSTGRSELSVCVDGAAGYDTDAADLEAVQAALQRGLDANPGTRTEYGEPLVSAGCPAPPAALTDASIKAGNRSTHLSVRVDVPSEHMLFVYFMPAETYAASFGSEPYAKADAEFRCMGDACVGETLSVYAPQAIDPDSLQQALMDILNVLPLLPEPTVDWQACEEGGDPGLGFTCRDYDDYKRDLELEQGSE